MITCNTEVVASPKNKFKKDEPFLDERLIDYNDEKLIYVRRGSQRDSRRIIGKNNLNFENSHLSKEHACLQYRDGILFIKDCGSTFGTTINDKFIVANTWHLLGLSDTIGFIVSKPSTCIAKIVKKYPSDRDIPLEEFSNPPIGLRLSFEYSGDNQLKFSVVKDDKDSRPLSKDESLETNANETYDTDAYYFDDCLEVDKKHPKECSCAERSCTEGNEEEFECKVVETEVQLDNSHQDTDKQCEFVTDVETSSLDVKGTVGNSNLNDHELDLDISSTHESRVAKSEDLDDVESCSFGHFTSEIISESDLDSESDFSSEFSNSDSNSSSNSSSSSSSSSDSSSSISESNESDPELDTSGFIGNIDLEEANDWSCRNISCSITSGSNSQGSITCGLPLAIVPVLDRTEGLLNTSHLEPYNENKKKRSFDEYQGDIQSSDEEHESKKIKPSPAKDNFTFKTIAKEVAKGVFYALATITALGIYGSTIDNQE